MSAIELAAWIALEIVIQQHTAQVGMTREFDAIHIVGLAFQPVGGRPDRYDAINLWFFRIEAHLDLKQLLARERAQVIDGLQVVKHIYARNAAQHIKTELIAQKATDGDQVGTVYLDAEIIALHALWSYLFAGDLGNWSQVARKRGVFIAIARS